MSPDRTYSYEQDEQHNYSPERQGRPQPYSDMPTREIISPPPQYATHLMPEPPSPVSLSHAQPYNTHHSRVSEDTSREPSLNRYVDRTPSPPPPPPPHRTSPSRHSRTNSAGKRSVAGPPIPMDDIARSYDGRPRSQAPSERMYAQGTYDRRGPQPAFNSQSYHQNGAPFMQGPYLGRPHSHMQEQPSYGSNLPLAHGAATPGSVTPSAASDMRSSRFSSHSMPSDEYPSSNPYRMSHYRDSPYHNSGHNIDTTVSEASINPQIIADDGDDDFVPASRHHQTDPSHNQHNTSKSGAAVTVGAPAVGGLLGGMFGRNPHKQTASGSYRPVENTAEKNGWLARDNQKRKRSGWLCGIGIGVVILIVLCAGIVGGVMGTRSYKTGGAGNINNANDDTAANGDLDINSKEIQALLNNKNLKKVFPGMDYTPWGVQYPLCEQYPPSQNNVTRDMAVLSQLTNTIRLYGTDCNQTEMVLHSVDRLKLKNIKIWLGVWIDTNQTTTDRQIAKMYKILENVKDKSIFKGAIIGNEALYRAGEEKAQSKKELIQILKDVKSNFTSLGYNLPVATSDLGDNWDADLVTAVDYVMSNIHPFFAGVSASQAAAWTWNFWQTHDTPLTASYPNVKQIISETGWPSGGGTDCGGTDGTCASGQSGATASVDNMNTFMADWVCQALANGTDYFWFEAFDEPWKVQYNTAGKAWEDKWGLLDSGRNLKPGVKIPSCGGQTVS